MKRILLAEDEDVLRMLIVDTLEDEEYEVDEAADGEEALHLIEQNEYDLLILDYMMPVYTGMEVIEKVRETSKVKILMLSAKSQQYEQEKILSIGANDFMAKPFSPLQLLDKVQEMLHED
ncbi:response regulator transcription factor [Bacillus sp. CGMCC 1.16607]|uniref:response regulator transcription factor n=1 Tax=Bacillus sp. CGMCC 1.16607 TaxID=3351842 RepID=UPI0036329A0A